MWEFEIFASLSAPYPSNTTKAARLPEVVGNEAIEVLLYRSAQLVFVYLLKCSAFTQLREQFFV